MVLTEFLKRRIESQRSLILPQILKIRGLMGLLMKVRNSGEPWTPEELREIRSRLWDIAKLIPIVVVFILPGGLLLLPILAEVLDRRNTPRR